MPNPSVFGLRRQLLSIGIASYKEQKTILGIAHYVRGLFSF